MRGDGRVFKRRERWWIGYSVRGQERRESVAVALGKPPRLVKQRDATALLRGRLAAIEVGTYVSTGRVTVKTLVADYLASLEANGCKSRPSFTAKARRVVAAFGHVRAVDLTTAAIERYMTERLAEGAAKGTVNFETAVLRAALKLAHRRSVVARVPHVPSFKLRNARQGFVEPETFAVILPHLREPHAAVARFLYASCWRLNEALGLTWAAVDTRGAEVRIGDTKNGDARALPIAHEIAAVLELRQRSRTVGAAIVPWVFHRAGKPISDDAMRVHWKRACRAAGVPALIPHDMRRSAARNMINSGVPEAVAMKIGGWRSRRMLDRYHIVTTDDMRRAMTATAAYVDSRTRGAQSSVRALQVPVVVEERA